MAGFGDCTKGDLDAYKTVPGTYPGALLVLLLHHPVDRGRSLNRRRSLWLRGDREGALDGLAAVNER